MESQTYSVSVKGWLSGAGYKLKEGNPDPKYDFAYLAYKEVPLDGLLFYSFAGSDRTTVLGQIQVGEKVQASFNSSPGIQKLADDVTSSLRKSGVFYKVDRTGAVPSRVLIYDLIPVGALDSARLLAAAGRVTDARTKTLYVYKDFVDRLAKARAPPPPTPQPQPAAQAAPAPAAPPAKPRAFCGRCGAQLKPNAGFCSKCGQMIG